jgi:hypothetical protein
MLGISPVGYEQDWELEFSDRTRIDEFIDLYASGKLSRLEKQALASLIVSSLDDLMSEDLPSGDVLGRAAVIFQNDFANIAEVLEDWICNQKDEFHISPFLRNLFVLYQSA